MALSAVKKQALYEGAFIPAHPLALHSDKSLDEEAQRRLTRYYIEAGVGGIAVGVHTTQFEIRDPKYNLFEKVLRMAMEEAEIAKVPSEFLMIAGVSGPSEQAVEEAELAKRLGYDLVLVSNGGLADYTEEQLLERTRRISQVIPVFGFYLQPAVGGRRLSFNFWEQLSSISGVLAIKMAPFDRYETLQVARAVCESDRRDEIALYTGNDDNIILDLFTTFSFSVDDEKIEKQIVGGLLGHWSVWTEKSVQLFNEIKEARQQSAIDAKWLKIAQSVTDSNAAFFDPVHDFKGSIAGINEVLRRQGLLRGNWCLSDNEVLSEGQSGEITRVQREYPELDDKLFVDRFLNK